MEQGKEIAKPVEELKSMFLNDSVKKRFAEILGKKSAGFISSVLSVVNNNDLLKNAEASSVLNSAVIAATLDLPINPNLGYAAIVPYNDTKNRRCLAQFQIMRNGLVELCLRSGQFASIIDEVVYEGQLVKKNKFTGEYTFDEDAKTSDKIIGYMAYFRLLNGFEKTYYITVDEAKQHASKYSKTYKKGFGVWVDNFDAMARKTALKTLLNKYAPKSIQMQQALMFDQSVVNGDLTKTSVEDADVEYIDNNDKPTDKLAGIAAQAAGITKATDVLDNLTEMINESPMGGLFNE